MKFLLPILLALALAVVLVAHQKRAASDEHWQRNKAAMAAMRPFIQPGTIIGCPLDSNHTRDFYECRYWLAPVVLRANAPATDTQLIITILDGRPVRPDNLMLNYSVIHTISSDQATYSLVKKLP
jgi:hypothetical protein